MKKLMSFFAIISGILWGSGGIFVRTLTNMGVDAYTIISQRVIFAVLILLAVLLVYNPVYLKIKIKDFFIKP